MVDEPAGHNADFGRADRDRAFATYRAHWANVCRASNLTPQLLATLDPSVCVALVLIHLSNRCVDLEARIVRLEGKIAKLQPKYPFLKTE